MQANPETVFLLSGQLSTTASVDKSQIGPQFVQRVVVAPDEASAYRCIREKEPGFRPLGAANLRDYELAAENVRAVLNGTKTDWPLYVA